MTWTDFKEYSSDVQLQIGQRIQKLRIDKKIAAVDLAAVLDIQSNQMSRIENGRANCTVPQLYVISQILGCSVDYLLFGKQCLTISQEQADSIKVLMLMEVYETDANSLLAIDCTPDSLDSRLKRLPADKQDYLKKTFDFMIEQALKSA